MRWDKVSGFWDENLTNRIIGEDEDDDLITVSSNMFIQTRIT